MGAIRYGPGEGLRRTARGNEMFFKATGVATGGRFSLMERTLPAGAPLPPPHRHPENEEVFFVLDGTVEFVIDDEAFEGTAGTFVLVPRGATHTFGNAADDDPARLLVLHAPALDEYFADLEALWSDDVPPSRDQERTLMRRHGMEPT